VIPLDSERDGEAAFGDIWVTHFAGTDVWRIHPSLSPSAARPRRFRYSSGSKSPAW